VRLYHATVKWDGGDLLSLHKRTEGDMDAMMALTQERWNMSDNDAWGYCQDDGLRVSLVATPEEALEIIEEYLCGAGQILEVNLDENEYDIELNSEGYQSIWGQIEARDVSVYGTYTQEEAR